MAGGPFTETQLKRLAAVGKSLVTKMEKERTLPPRMNPTELHRHLAQIGEVLTSLVDRGGYFDSGYLGYEAAEGIDWVWEHRIDDFSEFGL